MRFREFVSVVNRLDLIKHAGWLRNGFGIILELFEYYLIKQNKVKRMTLNHLKTYRQKSLKLNSSFEILTQPFQLDFTRFFIWLLICAVILSVTGLTAGLTSNYYGQELEKDRLLFRFVQLFNLNLEANIPSWYSGFLMIIVAALNYLIYKFERSVIKKYFLVISVLFIAMSIDEIT